MATSFTPMLASIGNKLPTGRDWVFEPKYDGIRILAFVDAHKISLVSRNGIDKTRQFPEVADGLSELFKHVKRPFVVDGEIVATHRAAPARFQALQGRMHVTNSTAIESLRKQHPAALMVFDILRDGKETLVGEPWRTRRKRLEALFASAPAIRSVRMGGAGSNGAAMLRRARQRGWEGVIAKRADAHYDVGRRSRAWLKLKIEHRQEFVVGGWTEPRRSREYIGSLLLGYYDRDGSFIYAGHTGTGFTRASLADMYDLLKPIERKQSPFDTPPRANEVVHWTRPSIVVEIKFNEWTSDGRLRQPVFVGVRTDKPARDVIREPESLADTMPERPSSGRVRAKASKRVAASAKAKPAKRTRRRQTKPITHRAPRATRSTVGGDQIVQALQEIETSGGSGVLELPTGKLEVSNLDKIYFPATKHTKGDVMRFYATIAPMILPAIADRPLVMKRYPNGVRGKAFYQQRAPDNPPNSVRVERVADEGYTPQDKLIGGDLATLLYLVQLGAISVDPWNSRLGSIKFADYSIIDLDPGHGATFKRVIEVAQAVKNVLQDFGLNAVPKTSGASGIHIVLPLGPRVPNDRARALAEMVAREVAEQYPKIATVVRAVARRPRGTVYVDYLQNIRGKTVAGVYSVRARPQPTVSTPLDWSEVDEDLDPARFTIDTVPQRLRTVGDLWAEGMRKPNSLRGRSKNV